MTTHSWCAQDYYLHDNYFWRSFFPPRDKGKRQISDDEEHDMHSNDYPRNDESICICLQK